MILEFRSQNLTHPGLSHHCISPLPLLVQVFSDGSNPHLEVRGEDLNQQSRMEKRMKRMERIETDFLFRLRRIKMSQRRVKVRFNPFHPFSYPAAFAFYACYTHFERIVNLLILVRDLIHLPKKLEHEFTEKQVSIVFPNELSMIITQGTKDFTVRLFERIFGYNPVQLAE